MDDESMTEILSGRHLNMAERSRRGIWPHEPLPFDSVVSHLTRVIQERDWFPRRFVPSQPGEMVADVTAVERRGDQQYVVHVQRSGSNEYILAERGAQVFSSAEAAARFYLKAEFNLPGDLDGWKVVP